MLLTLSGFISATFLEATLSLKSLKSARACLVSKNISDNKLVLYLYTKKALHKRDIISITKIFILIL